MYRVTPGEGKKPKVVGSVEPVGRMDPIINCLVPPWRWGGSGEEAPQSAELSRTIRLEWTTKVTLRVPRVIALQKRVGLMTYSIFRTF